MALQPGTRLGPYEIVAPLGAGGMGEVYRAYDARLQRTVAIKVLPPRFARDDERLRRFEREARSASALNHPSIVTIHDVGSVDGTSYIAMELVEGKTLRETLSAAALPLRRAVEIAAQVAGGLAAAHAAGIVHRDLKPENIVLRADGLAKVLDFGLAKLATPESPEHLTSARTDSALTGSDVVLGTVGYMAPEQASGHSVDARTDQFAFGAILYEMITGRLAFDRPTKPETLTAILREEPPPIESLNANVPAQLRWIAERCLRKEPAQRYASTTDLALELHTLIEHFPEVSALSGAGPVTRTARSGGRRLWLLLLVAAAAGPAGWWLRSAGSPRPGVPICRQVTFKSSPISRGVFAPDGKSILYSAFDGPRQEVYLLSPGSRESRRLGVQGYLPSVSSSGEMALLQDGILSVAPMGGGAPRALFENIVWAAWAPDGKSLALARRVENRTQIEYPAGHVVSPECGEFGFSLSPDGERLAMNCHGVLYVLDKQGRRTRMTDRSSPEFLFLPGGKEVLVARYERGATDLVAVSMDGRERQLASLPGSFVLLDISPRRELLTAVGVEPWITVGRLRGDEHDRNLGWLDATLPADLSADGRTLLISEVDTGNGTATTYVRNTDSSPAVALGPGFARALSPDGRLALVQPDLNSPALALMPTGAGERRVLPTADLEAFGHPAEHAGSGFLPDGKAIVFSGQSKGGKPRIYVQDVFGGNPKPISPEGVTMNTYCRPSPDGTSVLGVTSQRWTQSGSEARWAGTYALYPIGGGEGKRIPGLAAGEFPVGWSADGKGLYVIHDGDSPIAVSLLDVAAGTRKPWKTIAHPSGGDAASLQIMRMTPDGESYVMAYSRWLATLWVVEGLR